MRITREILIRIARETARERAYSSPGLVAAYLVGSLLGGSPLLGGTADIDIVFIHSRPPRLRREIIALTPDVHLDLIHNPRSDYEKPRELRLDPWRGPELYDPLPLPVGEGFFEFVQAGVRDRYNEPASIRERTRRLTVHARQVWAGLGGIPEEGPERLLSYLKAIHHAANAVALAQGALPLSERRFLLQFPLLATSTGRASLSSDLFSLLGADDADPEGLQACLAAWEKDFTLAAGRKGVSARIALPRLPYYRNACQAMLTGGSPFTLLWPMLFTWTLSARALPPTRRSTWEGACRGLGLLGPALQQKISLLDHFLDSIEEMLDSLPE